MTTRIKPQKPAQEFFDLLDQIINNENNTKDCFNKAVQIAQEAGFTDTEIANFMRDYCKDKIPRTTLWRWTKPLVPMEKNDDKNDKEESDSQGGFIPDDEEIPEDKVWKPDNEEYEKTKKQLTQQIADSAVKDEKIKDLQRRNEQLESVVKTEAFKPASEIGEQTFHLTVGIDLEYFKSVKLERILPNVVSPLRNRGWKTVEIWARNISE